jgi:hypothetical protein
MRNVRLTMTVAALTMACSAAYGQTLFTDDLNDNAAGWTYESLTGNFGITTSSNVLYGFDYSAVGIPEAPNTAPGDASRRGARLRTNLGNFPNDQAAISLTNGTFTGKYTVQVDVWMNWPPAAGAVGTTLHGGLYVGNATPGTVSVNDPVQRGAGFLLNTDGDCSNCDYILTKNQFEMDTFSGQYSVRDFGFGNQPGYDNTDVNADPANGALIDLPTFFPAVDIDAVTGGLQNAAATQDAGAAGFRWVTITAEVDPTDPGLGPAPGQTPSGRIGTTTFSITNTSGQKITIGKVDNSRPDILDDNGNGTPCDGPGSGDICVNLNNPTAGDVPVDMEGRISLVLIDFFQGGPSNPNLGFALFDNVKVFKPTASTQAGDFNGDGRVDGADLSLLLANWGSTVPPNPSGWTGDLPTATGIDADELSRLLANWGFGTSTSIPEPSSAALLAGLVCAAAARRR